ncbi:hypothetical protein [[Limnothrix rosea] IAM M-220]|uniref:hypothetical protein n=1 Tax=[Limnothrix rosea] IAM M-220 TaxID=454133 RepID=UPI000967EDEB|nr:hypothetical protein [[Limnothrix rosea] IAM M-220]OKH17505.1 hypothetical protein NIES208_09200 [[Limnothrix rosea] IAM M-220]
MILELDLTGLTQEQISQLQAIIEAFKAKNQLEQITIQQEKEDILDTLTKNPIEVDGFLNREEIHTRSA